MQALSRFHPWRARRYFGCLAAVALVSAGCGEIAENLLEEGVEQAIENDSGEDFELDFDGENGVSIETDEGSMTIDGDGNFVVEGADGEVITGEATDEGFTVTDEDGNAVLDVDEDNGTVTAETEDGSFTSGPGMPEGWPGSIPQPEGLDDLNGSTITTDGQTLITASGTAPDGAGDYFEAYESSLENAGFERSNYFESEGFRQGTYSDSKNTVSVASDEDSSTINVTLVPVEG